MLLLRSKHQAGQENRGLEQAVKERALGQGRRSAKGVVDVDTKPRDANDLLIQLLEKKSIGVHKMQMIIQQQMSQQ